MKGIEIKTQAMATMVFRWCVFGVSVLLPVTAPAAVHEGKGWRLEKWAEQTSVEPGGIIRYHLKVTRLASGSAETKILDVKNSTVVLDGYSNVTPPPDVGGTTYYLRWNRTLAEGETFEVSYEVAVDPAAAVGSRIQNYVIAEKLASSPGSLSLNNPLFDSSEYLSLDHYIFVGGGNQTKAGNRCTGETTDPVSTATGEYYIDPVTDLDLGGPLPLVFTRWYASRMNDPGINLIESALGCGWMHSFEAKGVISMAAGSFERTLRVILPGGKIATFAEVYTGSVRAWQLNHAQESVHYQFRDDGHSFWFMNPEEERIWRLSRISNFSQGPLHVLEILDRNGNRLELARSADGLVTNVSDGLGRSLAFTYSAASNLLAVNDGTRTVGFDYDATGTLAAATNAAGQTTLFRYDPVNSHANLQGALMTEVEYPRGNVPYLQVYNTNGQVMTQTDTYGAISTFEYGANGTTTVTDPQASFAHFHANYRRATNLADQAGNAFGIEYGAVRDLPSRISDRRGFQTSVEYEEDSRKPAWIVHRDGGTTTYSYVWTSQVFTNRETGANEVSFDFRDLHGITHPDGSTEQFHRDGRGNVTSYVDRAGVAWTTTYNERGQALVITRPGGGTRTLAYNADSTPASATDSDTGVTTYTYDALRRRTGAAHPDGSTEAWEYDPMDRVIRHTDRHGQHTDFTYDDNGLRVGVIDALGYAVADRTDLMDRATNRFDSLGLLWSRAYDDMGRIAATADPAGTNIYAYDARGWVTNLTREARSRSWEYDTDGHVVAAVSPLGHHARATYDAMGWLATTTDPLSNVTTVAYDAMGRTVGVENPLRQATLYAYDSAGRLRAFTNALGEAAAYAYDADGNRTRATDAEGHTTTYAYTPMGRLAAITNALGEAIRFTYDTSGRLLHTEFADATRVILAYDDDGRLRATTDEAGQTWRHAYDARGDLVAVTNPAGGVITTVYRLDGTVEAVRDSDTGVFSNRYDASRRLSEEIRPDGTSTRYEYNAYDERIATTDALGHRTQFDYDADGRLTRITDAHGQHADFAYNAAGRLTNAVDRTGGDTRCDYDAAGRLAAVTDPTGVRTAYARDALGRATNTTVGTFAWRTDYNRAGVVTNRVAPSGRATAFVPDALGRIAATVDALGRTNKVTRDVRGRIVRHTDPHGRATDYAYDPRGLLAGVTLPDATGAAYARDALGNVSRLTDAASNVWDFTYTPMGRLLALTDPLDRATQYAYDPRGQVADIAYPDGATATLTRDAEGRVTRTQYSDGLDLRFGFDALGRLTNANAIAISRDAEGRVVATENPGTVFGATYDAAGRLATAAYHNDAFAVHYTYAVGPTGDGRLTSVSDTITGTQVNFAYDADRRLVTVTLSNGETIAYTWDASDRLIRLQSGHHVDIGLTYDRSGRVTAQTLTAPLVPAGHLDADTNALTFDAVAQISSAGYAYDARGRLTQSTFNLQPSSFSWDGASRLTGINGVALVYNGLGQLSTRASGSDTTRFYYNHAIGGAPIVAEQDEAGGQMLRYYVWTPSGRLLYLIDAAVGNKVYFYHFDQVGSTLVLTDTNAAVTDAWAYDPHGRILERTGSQPQSFTFVGAWGVRQEGEDGLYQMRARYYDAATARFLSPEPIWPQLDDPKALNPYQYAANDPIRFADPSGWSLFNIVHSFDPGIQEWMEDGIEAGALLPNLTALQAQMDRLSAAGGNPSGGVMGALDTLHTYDPANSSWYEEPAEPALSQQKSKNTAPRETPAPKWFLPPAHGHDPARYVAGNEPLAGLLDPPPGAYSPLPSRVPERPPAIVRNEPLPGGILGGPQRNRRHGFPPARRVPVMVRVAGQEDFWGFAVRAAIEVGLANNGLMALFEGNAEAQQELNALRAQLGMPPVNPPPMRFDVRIADLGAQVQVRIVDQQNPNANVQFVVNKAAIQAADPRAPTGRPGEVTRNDNGRNPVLDDVAARVQRELSRMSGR